MRYSTTLGVDLAKNTIQIVELSRNNQVKTNKSLSPDGFKKILATHVPMRIVFEACASSHYWARLAAGCDHEAIILSATFVAGSRQGHKTDANDALACAVASRHPKAQPIAIKTETEQGMQAVERAQQALTKQSIALSNMIISLLFEFGIRLPKRSGELSRRMMGILEDAENGIPHFFRETLMLSYEQYVDTKKRLAQVESQLRRLVVQDANCKRLLDLEGVGPINALGLYLSIGDGQAFKNGRAASACVGLTPKQYSTGGKVKLGGIGKKRGNQRLRYTLFQGAMSVLRQLEKRPPRTEKEKWFLALIERRGARCAAIAYANKTVRTAWALLRYKTTYQAKALVHA